MEAEEVLEERTQEGQVARDDGDAHLHEGPAAGVDLREGGVVGCEVYDGLDADGACDADTVVGSAMYVKRRRGRGHLQASEQENSHQGNLASQVDMQLQDHRNG